MVFAVGLAPFSPSNANPGELHSWMPGIITCMFEFHSVSQPRKFPFCSAILFLPFCLLKWSDLTCHAVCSVLHKNVSSIIIILLVAMFVFYEQNEENL